MTDQDARHADAFEEEVLRLRKINATLVAALVTWTRLEDDAEPTVESYFKQAAAYNDAFAAAKDALRQAGYREPSRPRETVTPWRGR